MAFRPCKQAACGYRAFPQKIPIMGIIGSYTWFKGCAVNFF